MKKKIPNYRDGFTLIELLVVITIIGILAGIALPVYSTIQERGLQTKVLTQAKQIGLGLKLYASDYGGTYPTDGSTDPENPTTPITVTASNDAFRVLIPGYVPSEEIFYVSGSAYCNPTPPDEAIDGANRLAAGENHFSYVDGLRETSNPRIPLLADGMANTSGGYAEAEDALGGLWKGNKAIVIRVDQSGAIENLDDSQEVVGPRGDGTQGNIFDLTSWGLTSANIRNPS